MRIEIDLADISTRQQFQDRVQQMLPCPDYYGRNLDALYDVLTDFGEELELVFLNFVEFAHQMPGYAEAVENMCADAQAENPLLHILMEQNHYFKE